MSSTNGNTMLNPDFKDFIQLLNANQVRYFVNREADRLGVTPQSIIQGSLASQFALHNP